MVRSTIHAMDINLRVVHQTAQRIPGTDPDHGSSGPFYKSGTFH